MKYPQFGTFIAENPDSFYTQAPRTGRVTWISKDWYVDGDTFSPGHHIALPLSQNQEIGTSIIWSLEKQEMNAVKSSKKKINSSA